MLQQNTLNITSLYQKVKQQKYKNKLLSLAFLQQTNSKVQSIYIDRYISKGDSTIEQKLFWEIDKYFSITDIIEKENQPEKIHSTKSCVAIILPLIYLIADQ